MSILFLSVFVFVFGELQPFAFIRIPRSIIGRSPGRNMVVLVSIENNVVFVGWFVCVVFRVCGKLFLSLHGFLHMRKILQMV